MIRAFASSDRGWAADGLTEQFGGPMVARRGELVDPLVLPGFVAEVDGAPVGLLTYLEAAGDVEVVTLFSRARGMGRALMDAVAPVVPTGGRLWLITTNPNTAALRFYQRWGMDIVAVHRDAVRRARALKPTIPLMSDGIPLRHEIELEWRPSSANR